MCKQEAMWGRFSKVILEKKSGGWFIELDASSADNCYLHICAQLLYTTTWDVPFSKRSVLELL